MLIEFTIFYSSSFIIYGKIFDSIIKTISLTFAGLTTRCKSLLRDHTCPGSGYIYLTDASSLEACPSECEKAGDGAVGCCVWQHDRKKCLWYANTQIIQAHVNGYRSAVSCTSK